MFDFIDSNGSFVVQRSPEDKDIPKLGKILGRLTNTVPFDIINLLNREGGPVVITSLKTEIARKFTKVALFQGIRLEIHPMAEYYQAPEVTPKRMEFVDDWVIIKSDAPNQEDITFPFWETRNLRLGQLSRLDRKQDEAAAAAQGAGWSLRSEDVDQMVAEVSTPGYRVFLLPGKLLYQHLDPPEPNSAKNYHRTLNLFLEIAPACEADEATRAWCECRAHKIPIYKNLATFKKDSLALVQPIMF